MVSLFIFCLNKQNFSLKKNNEKNNKRKTVFAIPVKNTIKIENEYLHEGVSLDCREM